MDQQNLEMNHTHFIFLDDETVRSHNIGDYRPRLAKTIANECSKHNLPSIYYFLQLSKN